MLVFLLFGLTYGGNEWNFSGTLTSTPLEEEIKFSAAGRAIFYIESLCSSNLSTSFLQHKLYDTETLKTVLFVDIECGGHKTVSISPPGLYTGDYNLTISGKSSVQYRTVVALYSTDLQIDGKQAADEVLLPNDQIVVRSFEITPADIATSQYSYVQVGVTSPDIYLNKTDSGSEDPRFVGILMVTKDPKHLTSFFASPEAGRSDSMHLSFSSFGMITLSNASKPVLSTGTWLVALAIKSDIRDQATYSKKVNVTITIRTDYGYKSHILALLGVSLLGFIVPILARIIFKAGHMDFSTFQWRYWLLTVKNWFWSGRKGLTYQTALLAVLLIVSAFQVVHARYADMYQSGNRDLCYYNEKCYRPYGEYYDVSVNGVASNLVFMVHGAILVIYFSFSEAYCRSNDHTHFDYSIPYSFGLAFICEGFGSLLYHICPSQIIFQFDTLFMFVITIIMIVAIFEGNSIRDNDIQYTLIASHKALRTSKVFAFFIGPLYYFNFVGNLAATEGLPLPVMVVFYIFFGAWLILILAWAAYKLGLLPKSWDPDCPQSSTTNQVLLTWKNSLFAQQVFSHSKTLKTIVFGLYCVLVGVGFVSALLQQVSFSIVVLGLLCIAVLLLTLIFFVPLMWTILQFFYSIPVQIKTRTCSFSFSKHVLVLTGTIVYVLLGCAVSAVSLFFFSTLAVTNKSISPARSRELNGDCFLNNFYDTHDFWHLFSSFALMMMTLVIVQICKPCRDCYMVYLKRLRRESESAAGGCRLGEMRKRDDVQQEAAGWGK